MGIDIQYIKHKEYLEVIASGSYDLDSAITAFGALMAECRATGLSKMLIDFRKIEGVSLATEKYIYGASAKESYLRYLKDGGQPLRVAYLGSAPLVSTYEPGLEIARESKLPFNLFTDIDEAFAWLGVDREN